jgi:tetratricopeptide (TPR) repeat protein
LAALKDRAYGLQEEFSALFPQDLNGAERNAAQTLDLLDQVLPSYPNDWRLQNLRAYAAKNYAMVMRARGNDDQFKRALSEAEKMFEAIRQQEPDDPGAWNGLGSVALLRNDPSNALNYIDRALEIRPDYEAARHDRTIAVRMLQEKAADDVQNKSRERVVAP